MKPAFPILLIEDDIIDVMALKRAFRDLQMTNPLQVAGNGEEALHYLRDALQPRPGLILLDLNMPRMNGVDFLRVVKSDTLLRRIPVVVLTTSKEHSDRSEAFNLGAAGYMVKGIDYPEFIQVVRTIHAYWDMSELPPIA
jgi:CheY-like chemotaxis protein